MPSCPQCGYEMQPFETECPKCARAGVQDVGTVKKPAPPSQLAPREEAHPSESPSPAGEVKATHGALMAAGALAGAIYGAVVLVAFVLVDRVIFGCSETRGMGLIPAVGIAAVLGAVFGAVVGIPTTLARSAGAGIAMGAIVWGVLKGLGMSFAGFSGGFAVMGLVVGAIYGALIGWAVATSVMKSVKWDELRQ